MTTALFLLCCIAKKKKRLVRSLAFPFRISQAYIKKGRIPIQVFPVPNVNTNSFAIKMHICMSSQQQNVVYALWQEVPKLVYTFWTCKPVLGTRNT